MSDSFYDKHGKTVRAMMEQESGRKPLEKRIDTDGTNQESCGFLQIKKDYYDDAAEYGNRQGYHDLSASGGWEKCAKNEDWSVKCIENYMRRYGSDDPSQMSNEDVAKLHNGGPGGRYSEKADDYWNKVQGHMERM